MKACPRCDHPNVPKGDKYCEYCTRAIKREMRESGYLTRVPKRRRERPAEAQEDRHETAFGIDDQFDWDD